MKEEFLNRKSAFTLVELIVVIMILIILGTIGFISFRGYSKNARDSVRVSDISNIKTSLELYFVDSGEYPKPDNFTTINYGGDILWYQGFVGDGVIISLKSLNKKLLDPRTNTPYIYSITNSLEEYQLLALYEGNIAYNNVIFQANAYRAKLIPKIDGNYNKVFLETTNYIIPTPSIITSELLTPGSQRLLTSTTIKSQVITNGKNIPQNIATPAITGQLNINLSVYTGSITGQSTKVEKINAVQKIQGAYSGSSLITKDNISYILNQTSTEQIISLANSLILKLPTTSGIVTDWRRLDPNCDIPDINIYSGSVLTQTWAGCNSTIGNGFEWGQLDANIATNNYNGTVGDCYDYNGNTGSSVCSPGNILMASSTKANAWFTGANTIGDFEVNNIWGKLYTWANASSACVAGYHLPSDAEWTTAENTMDKTGSGLGWKYHSNANLSTSIAEKLKIPLSGYRLFDRITSTNRGFYSRLWSSTPSTNNAYYRRLRADYHSFYRNTNNKLDGFSVRCIKD